MTLRRRKQSRSAKPKTVSAPARITLHYENHTDKKQHDNMNTDTEEAKNALQGALRLYEEAYSHNDVKALTKDSREILHGMQQFVVAALNRLEG